MRTLRAVGVGAAADVENRDDEAILIDEVADAVAAASGDPVTCVRSSQRLAESLWIVPKCTIDEFPSRGSNLHGQFIGERAARGSGKLDAVSHAEPVASRTRSATSRATFSPAVTSPDATACCASARRC